MNKRYILIIVCILVLTLSSCAVFKRPLENRSHFSELLSQTERHIRGNNWAQAQSSLKQSEKAWYSIKPVLQIDIDHDYVNEVEDQFTQLRGYLAVKDKSNALASILSIQNLWNSIDQM